MPFGFENFGIVTHECEKLKCPRNFNSLPELQTAGLVLSHANFGEADRTLRIFTCEFGLVAALAKGIRRPRSRLSATLELFTTSDLRLHRRTGEFFLVTGASPLIPIPGAIIELPRLAAAYAAAEWTLALAAPEKPLLEVWQLWVDFLRILPTTKKLELLRVAFVGKLLADLGYLGHEPSRTRAEKVLRFVVTHSLSAALTLEEDHAACVELEQIFAETFQNLTGKRMKTTHAFKETRVFSKF